MLRVPVRRTPCNSPVLYRLTRHRVELGRESSHHFDDRLLCGGRCGSALTRPDSIILFLEALLSSFEQRVALSFDHLWICRCSQKAFRMKEGLECRGKRFGFRRDQRNWVYWRESSIVQRIPDVGGGFSLCLLIQSAGVLTIRIHSLN